MDVTLVRTPACHLCQDAEAVLARFAGEFVLRIEVVEAGSPTGQRLVRAHRAALFPLVLLDGELVSAGRLPRGKLRRLLERRAARCHD